MGDTTDTVRIQDGAKGYTIINKDDFVEGQHKLYTGKPSDDEGGIQAPGTRNTSGTYSEPTPTDIRYPDKDHTEFENNHGAFIGKSAAEMRDEKGLPDAPGGLKPDEGFKGGLDVTEASKDDKAAAGIVDATTAEKTDDGKKADDTKKDDSKTA